MGRICLLIYYDSVHHLIITSANDCLDIELFIPTQNWIVQGATANDGRPIPSKYLDLSWYLRSLHGSNLSHLSLPLDESWQSSQLWLWHPLSYHPWSTPTGYLAFPAPQTW